MEGSAPAWLKNASFDVTLLTGQADLGRQTAYRRAPEHRSKLFTDGSSCNTLLILGPGQHWHVMLHYGLFLKLCDSMSIYIDVIHSIHSCL